MRAARAPGHTRKPTRPRVFRARLPRARAKCKTRGARARRARLSRGRYFGAMVGAGQPVVQEFTDDEVAGAAQALKLAFGSYDGESAYPEWVQGQLAKARRALQSGSTPRAP